MFGLFGRKPKTPEDIIPELRNYVVELQDRTGISYFHIAESMLNVGIYLTIKDKGLLGLASVLEALPSLIKEKQTALGNLGSAVLDVQVPEQPKNQFDLIVGKLMSFASKYIGQGYSNEIVGSATMLVWGRIVELLDKDQLFSIALLRKEYKRRFEEFRRLRLRSLASGEICTGDSLNILLQAEDDGFELTVENDGTFALKKENSGTSYLRSNYDIDRFWRRLKTEEEAKDAARSPVERLIEQGRKHEEEHRPEDAIISYSAALRIKPDNPEMYFRRGFAWTAAYWNHGNKVEDLQAAIDDFGRAIDINPDYGEAYYGRAEARSILGEVDDAIADYSQAIVMRYMVSVSHSSRASLWRRSSHEARNTRAIEDFDTVIRIGDAYSQFMALIGRGEVHLDLGNCELAIADLTAATAYYPNSPPGLYQKRAAAFRQLGRIREASGDLDKAIAALTPMADPGLVADIYDKRGECRAQLGDAQLARQDFQHAAQLRRENR